MNLKMQAGGTGPQTKQVAGICLLLALLVLAVFGQTAHFSFVGYDDQTYVFKNPIVQRGLSWQAVGWAFSHAQVSDWIPLTTLSHMLDCQLFGLSAGAHHLVNVFWHAASVVLLFLGLRRLTGSIWRSALVAALFAVHPLRAESVAWVSERKDVLSGFFFMLALWAYAGYVKSLKAPCFAEAGVGKEAGARRLYYVLVLVFFAMGLMAKGMVATLPFVLLLLDYWPLGRWRNGRELLGVVREKIPLFVISAADCVATARMPGLMVPSGQGLPFSERISNALVSYEVYLRQMIFPAKLAAHYPLQRPGQAGWMVALAMVLLTGITAGVVAMRRAHPYLVVGWLWYLGMLFPVIGIVQISSDAAHADRYTYLPGIGLAVAGVWAAGDWEFGWWRRPVLLWAIMAAWIGVLAVCGWQTVSYWRNDQLLWTRALACTSDAQGNDWNDVAHNGLGNALSEEGKTQKGKKAEAIAEYRKALQINPGYNAARFNLGIALVDNGDVAAGIAQYRQALQIDPAYAEARYSLGIALGKIGELQEALPEYEQAVRLKPEFIDARYNFGNALLQLGKTDEAVRQYQGALEIAPDDARILNNLGIALAIQGKDDEAIVEYRKALAAQPDFVDARDNLGIALVKKGSLAEAIAEYQRALAINPNYAKARRDLGKALLRKGDFDGAMKCFPEITKANSDASASWSKLGDDLVQHGELEEATICCRRAIGIDPRSGESYANLGLACAQLGQTKGAIDAWEKALEIMPDQAGVLNGLAWLLATTPDALLRNGAKSLALAEKANQMSGGGSPMVLQTLAAAYAEVGRYGEAADTARRAYDLAKLQKDADLSVSLPSEIKLYEANKPWRDLTQ